MSGLIGSLSSVARALEAQRFGLDATGHNIANVNTPGFRRRIVEFESIPSGDASSAGGGVRVKELRAARDRLIEQRLIRERPGEQREAALADALGTIELIIGAPGKSLDSGLNGLFDAFARLAEDPTSATARSEVITYAQSLSNSFHDLDARLDAARHDANITIRTSVNEVNELAGRLARANAAVVGRSAEPETLEMHDEQARIVQELSELLDVDVIERGDGAFDVAFGNGRPLVIGDRAYEATVMPSGVDGMLQIMSGSFDVTTEISGGRIGGLLHVRDVLLPAYVDELDELAYTLTQELNAAHAAGFDLDGNAGGNFFTPLGTQAGAAGAIAVNPTLADNSRLIAAAGTTSPGDNQNARALAALRDAQVMDGGIATFADSWANLVFTIGRDTRTAQVERDSRGDVMRQIEALRDAVSGVSLDEEAVMMLKFQQAFEANARFFQVVERAVETMMQMVGV
jgi:flagellar hook-associated protein 1 FlgK